MIVKSGKDLSGVPCGLQLSNFWDDFERLRILMKSCLAFSNLIS
jgi:hypothetical protein